jgi:hypothetical protein
MVCMWSINPVSNPYPVYSHPYYVSICFSPCFVCSLLTIPERKIIRRESTYIRYEYKLSQWRISCEIRLRVVWLKFIKVSNWHTNSIFIVEHVVRKQRENDGQEEDSKLSGPEVVTAVNTAPCSRIVADRRCGGTSCLLVAFLAYVSRQVHFYCGSYIFRCNHKKTT